MKYALRIVVTGIVQGVGFRPFIHRIALSNRLYGYVKNVGGSEVEIWIEGAYENYSKFIRDLYSKKPPPAVIDEVEIYFEEPRGYTTFNILKSEKGRLKYSMIPPDLGICEYCLKEILDPSDRRYRYAFNSCAWCGPRYSMMYSVPYDRENTSMRKYKLCSKCFHEYTNINDIRRYHAQGISCPKDGPKLWITDSRGEVIDTKDPIKEAAKLIDEGYVLAIKGLGGYHIAALASNDDIVLKLRERKKRPTKPFAVMALDIGIARKLVFIDEKARILLESPQKPIVLLKKKPDTPVSRYVSPGLSHEGVFLPYTGLHYLLLMETRDKFLIMTSGNRHGKPMCIDEKCAYNELGSIVDYFLVHDREIVNRVDDSVIRFTCGKPILLRRGRGYAPIWIKIPFKLSNKYIAFGSDLQTAAAIGFDDKIVLTQYIGDVDDFDVLDDMDKYVRFLADNYGIGLDEAILVVDKHPHYSSRRLAEAYAEKLGNRIIEVQHHVAHVLSTAIDHGVYGRIIGIAIDGVGYGDDGAIWGGEVIEIDMYNGSYRRLGHLEYQPLVGDRSIYYPIRFFLSVLSKKIDHEELMDLVKRYKLHKRVKGGLREIEILLRSIERGVYVNTSSTGRLLDGVSAFLGVSSYRSYEGEPAIKLEAFSINGSYLHDYLDPRITVKDGKHIVKTTDLYMELIDLVSSCKKEDLAVTFQYNIGKVLGEIAYHGIRGRRNIIDKVFIGGGAAVNNYIVSGVTDLLKQHDIEVILPTRIPANDGGISLGQIIYAELTQICDP